MLVPNKWVSQRKMGIGVSEHGVYGWDAYELCFDFYDFHHRQKGSRCSVWEWIFCILQDDDGPRKGGMKYYSYNHTGNGIAMIFGMAKK